MSLNQHDCCCLAMTQTVPVCLTVCLNLAVQHTYLTTLDEMCQTVVQYIYLAVVTTVRNNLYVTPSNWRHLK